MLAAAQEEKRATRRKPFFRTVRVVLSSGTEYRVPPFDISHEGIGLILDFDIRRGTRATLRFPLLMDPENTVDIEVSSMCTRSHLSGKAGGFKTGMQFLDMSSRVAEAIKTFMEL